MIEKERTIATVLILLVLFVGQIQAQRQMGIGGFAVDSGGRPVNNIKICVWHEDSWPNECFRALDDGLFGRSIEWKEGVRVRAIIYEIPPDNCDLPFIPFLIPGSNSKQDPYESYHLIFPEYRENVDLGKFSGYIRYGRVKLDFSDVPEALIKERSATKVRAAIKSPSGVEVYRGWLRLNPVDDPDQYEFCMITGKWRYEFFGPEWRGLATSEDKKVIRVFRE